MELMVNISDFFFPVETRMGSSSKCKSLYAILFGYVCVCECVCNPCRENKRGGKRGRGRDIVGKKREREGEVSAVISIRFIVVQFPVPPVLPEGDYITFHHSFIFSCR